MEGLWGWAWGLRPEQQHVLSAAAVLGGVGEAQHLGKGQMAALEF